MGDWGNTREINTKGRGGVEGGGGGQVDLSVRWCIRRLADSIRFPLVRADVSVGLLVRPLVSPLVHESVGFSIFILAFP